MVLQYKIQPKPSHRAIFKKGDLVVLKKDYNNFEIAPDLSYYGEKHFTENRRCQVLSSGLFYYSADKKGNFIVLVDNCELCYVKAFLEESEYEYYECGRDLKTFTGIVRTADLRYVEIKDLFRGREL